MKLLDRAAALLGLQTRDASGTNTPAGVLPPPRSRMFSQDLALTISTVYRAVEVLAIGVSQLGMDQWRNDRRISPAALVQKPDANTHRPAFLEYTTVSLALDGNAYWLVLRDTKGAPISLQPLNPRDVTPARDTFGRRVFMYKGKQRSAATRTEGDIAHLQKLRVPGRERGLGPIEAARAELEGALDARDYSAGWFDRSDVPTGILTSDQVINNEQAKRYKQRWQGIDPETGERDPNFAGIRVLGSNLTYDSLQIKPADLQFLETQQFNTTQIARLFGTPASLMLAVVEGNSQSYSNVEQDWIAFTRFTLMAYLREIEETLSELLPYGNSVRFNVDALQRSDTLTRYQAHEVGIRAGFLLPEEARAIEGLDPLTPQQIATVQKGTNDAPGND